MELLNALYKYDQVVEDKNIEFFEEVLADLLRILSPFAPHFRRNWEQLGYEYSIFNQNWPKWDPNALVKDEVEIAVQINGKVKTRIMVPSAADNKEIEDIALSNEEVKELTKGMKIIKVIVVKGRLINIVVK